jgi:peptidoglycan hydrolase CwlO-like protein
VRDEDAEVRSTQAELRDLHHRIDSLKEEGERQYASLTDKLHQLEVTLARGTRFPAAAWVASAALVLSTVGTGAVLYTKLETANASASKALSLIEEHLKAAPTHRYNVERIGNQVDEWREQIPLLGERLKSLESRVVGQGPEGWHRRDHDTYAAMVATQIQALERRVQTAEEAQQHVCDRVRSCK